MKTLDWALKYAERGWAVLPVHSIVNGKCTCRKDNCSSPGKHPAIANGCHGASTDSSLIATWWSNGQPRNIGIATGSISGLLVVDIDVAPDKNGFESLAKLEHDHGALSNTLSVRTGSGGRHLYFNMPDLDLRNSAGRLGRGVDIRAEGGYVLAPPSFHISGQSYKWENYE